MIRFAVAAAVLFCTTTIQAGRPCHRQVVRVQSVIVNQQGLAVVPFAVPVAVPVATVNPGGVYYGYQQQAQPQAVQQQAPCPQVAHEQAVQEPQTAEPLTGETQAESTSLVHQHCAKCHTGEQAKAGFRLEAWTTLGAEQRLKMIRRVLSDDESTRMPKGKQLDPQTLGELIQELSE